MQSRRTPNLILLVWGRAGIGMLGGGANLLFRWASPSCMLGIELKTSLTWSLGIETGNKLRAWAKEGHTCPLRLGEPYNLTVGLWWREEGSIPWEYFYVELTSLGKRCCNPSPSFIKHTWVGELPNLEEGLSKALAITFAEIELEVGGTWLPWCCESRLISMGANTPQRKSCRAYQERMRGEGGAWQRKRAHATVEVQREACCWQSSEYPPLSFCLNLASP